MNKVKMPMHDVMHGKKEHPMMMAEKGMKEFMHPAKMGNLPGNPLTRTGEKVMRNMQEGYGSKKGKEVFYASMNKGIKGSKKWHG